MKQQIYNKTQILERQEAASLSLKADRHQLFGNALALWPARLTKDTLKSLTSHQSYVYNKHGE